MQFVQLLLTDDQASKLKVAVDLILEDPERYVMTEEETEDYQRLSVYFTAVAGSPAHFAPSGEMAKSVKRIMRRAKGPAKPQSRRNKRKERQAARQGGAKRRRAERREAAEQYNAALAEVMEQQAKAEAEQAELMARLEAEPKFQIVNAAGQVMFDGIPESMIRPVEAPVRVEPRSFEKPQIILPGTAEAFGIERP